MLGRRSSRLTSGPEADLIPELDRAGLRKFGIQIGLIFAILFGIAFPFVFGYQYPTWPWILAAILIVWGLAAPSSLRVVYRIWMRIGLLLNRIVSPIVLGFIFFIVVTPIGLIARVFGQDSMGRKRREQGTFRTHSTARESKHMERPY